MLRLRFSEKVSARPVAALLAFALVLASLIAVPGFAVAATLPQSCAEVRQQDPTSADGEYTLALQGHIAHIYCADMAGTPTEYISLARTGGTYNYSFFYGNHKNHYYQYWWVYGTHAVTNYNKIRINPATLVVDQNDQRFAVLTSEGKNGYDSSDPNFNPVPKSMAYATGGDCAASWSAQGKANVDLTGTDFALDDGTTFAWGGFAANGSVNVNPNRQIVNMTGGGWCGGVGPQGPLKLKLLTPLAPTDTTPPVTTASAPAGWQNHDVTVTLSATDDVSGVAATYWQLDGAPQQQGSSLVINTDGTHSLVYWSVDGAGNVEAQKSATIRIDKTAPVISYTGNAGTYAVDSQVNITCAAADSLSGVTASTCVDIAGPAFSFALGSNTFSASATDEAGNVGNGTAAFTVTVSYDNLCSLTRQFVSQDGVAKSLCAKLDGAKASSERGNAKSKAGQMSAFISELQAQSGKALTPEQAAILTRLAQAL
ncbi:MAG TPA: GON domain-containing protein [Symbiobacteriaceae bacterium]|nr:GON domain-containing protein [Symbiobacteriaceae bacterium]